MTHQDFLSDLFTEWSNDDLAEFIFDARDYAADARIGRVLTLATEIAGKLAESELEERETFQWQVQDEIWAELDAMRAEQERAAMVAFDSEWLSADSMPF